MSVQISYTMSYLLCITFTSQFITSFKLHIYSKPKVIKHLINIYTVNSETILSLWLGEYCYN